MKAQFRMALKFMVVMAVLTGIAYPLIMTGIAQICFPYKANGSLIMNDGKLIGSELIGQKFDSSVYFSSRPSIIGYNPIPSGASNWGPISDTLRKLTATRRIMFTKSNSIPDGTPIPTEMVFASASGLDPHISPEGALMQVDRIAVARNLDRNRKELVVRTIINMTEKPQFLFLGETRINVLKLNIELDRIDSSVNN